MEGETILFRKNSHFIAFLVASDDAITIVTAETNLGNILETWGIPFRENTLPDDYDYQVQSFTDDGEDSVDSFHAAIRIALTMPEEAAAWLTAYETHNKCTLRVLAKPQVKGKKVLFKCCYRCQHGTGGKLTVNERRSSKNTNCEMRLTMSVKRFIPTFRGCVIDPLMPKYAVCVTIKHKHNHDLETPDSIKFRDVSTATVEKLSGLYAKGYTPATALASLKFDLQVEYGTDYESKSADRAICPDSPFCYRLYHKTKVYRSPSGEQLHRDLEAAIRSYNTEDDRSTAMSVVDGHMAIAVCTSLMKRVHKTHKASGEMVFVDSTGGLDRKNSHVFLLMTHSDDGGLPLGVLITTSQEVVVVTAALKLLVSLLPTGAFFGKGDDGPQVFVTDDCTSGRKSLRSVFPKAGLLLCGFHILQANWRFLHVEKNRVTKQHRQHLLSLLKAMVFAASTEELVYQYNVICADTIANNYTGYLTLIGEVFERRAEWAVCDRQELTVHGNNTKQYAESVMRILKDKIVERVHRYNPIQLLDFMITKHSAYYEHRLNDTADGAHKSIVKPHLPSGKPIPLADITQTSELTFEVVNSRDRSLPCTVDLNLNMCSCNAGMTGESCKHQLACAHHFQVGATNLLDNDTATHSQMRLTGSNDVAACRFASRTAASMKANTTKKNKKRRLSMKDTDLADDDMAMADDATAMTSNEMIKKLDAMRDDMVRCLGGDPSYRAALERMLERYSRMSPSARISAFIAFGQSSDVAGDSSAGSESSAMHAGNGDHVYVNLESSNFPNHNVLSVHYPDGTIAYPVDSNVWPT